MPLAQIVVDVVNLVMHTQQMVIAVGGVASSTYLYLTFRPPASYLDFVIRRAAAAY
jgi:hypothetical protein